MIEYLYNATDGRYAGSREIPGNTLSYNGTAIAPEDRPGYMPFWRAGQWEYLEDHRGAKGYVNGAETEIKDFGPLPDGWLDTPPPPPLEEAKAAKLAEITAARNSAVDGGGAEYKGLHFWPDKGSKGDVLFAIKALEETGEFPQIWIAKDGALPLTAETAREDLLGIASAVGHLVEAVYMQAYALSVQVQAAQSVEEVSAIAWPPV